MVEKLEARLKQLRKNNPNKSNGKELYCDVQSLLIFIRIFFGLIANP